jgi:uncharacterized protein (UPF0548 family)
VPPGGPFWLRRPSPEQLADLLADQCNRSLTYSAVGATQSSAPPGYKHEHYSQSLGSEPGTFGRAVAALNQWAPQRGAGMQLTPESPVVTQDGCVVLLQRTMGGFVTAAARIVYVVDEPNRYGFAYGTLPHHPVAGEEAFLVEQDDAGNVNFVIEVFSRPRHPLARLGKPVSRMVQKNTTRRYMQGMLEAGRA